MSTEALTHLSENLDFIPAKIKERTSSQVKSIVFMLFSCTRQRLLVSSLISATADKLLLFERLTDSEVRVISSSTTSEKTELGSVHSVEFSL